MTVKNHPTLHGEGFWTAAKLEAASWVDCFRPGVARRSWVGIGLMFFQQVRSLSSSGSASLVWNESDSPTPPPLPSFKFVGINALIYYA